MQFNFCNSIAKVYYFPSALKYPNPTFKIQHYTISILKMPWQPNIIFEFEYKNSTSPKNHLWKEYQYNCLWSLVKCIQEMSNYISSHGVCLIS